MSFNYVVPFNNPNIGTIEIIDHKLSLSGNNPYKAPHQNMTVKENHIVLDFKNYKKIYSYTRIKIKLFTDKKVSIINANNFQIELTSATSISIAKCHRLYISFKNQKQKIDLDFNDCKKIFIRSKELTYLNHINLNKSSFHKIYNIHAKRLTIDSCTIEDIIKSKADQVTSNNSTIHFSTIPSLGKYPQCIIKNKVKKLDKLLDHHHFPKLFEYFIRNTE